jgi:chromosome segregation ATPase
MRAINPLTDYLGNGQRTKWADGKVQRLEDMLPEILGGIESASNQLRERRLEHAERERQWAEERRQREELSKRIKIEKQRSARLETEATAWQHAIAIRRLCDELEGRAQTEREKFVP